MAKPAKGLKTLIRLSKFNVDEKRRTLTALQTREDQVVEEIRRAEEQLVREQQMASENQAVAFAFPAYYRAWAQQRHALEQALTAVRQQIEAARDELAEAFREQKTYEVTQANREKREREEADRKEQIFLDEIGLNMHRRKGEEQAAAEKEEFGE